MTEVRYVRRDIAGNIVALFAGPQPGEDLEQLPTDHPDVVAYKEASNRSRTLLPLAFIDRFTDEEITAIDAQARLWLIKANASSVIELDNPRTIAGMDDLVALGIITEARKAEILS